MINALTIDVEEYFQVEAFSGVCPREEWPSYPETVERNTVQVLDLLHICRTKATFFVLGWVAERYPQLIRMIHAEGHEVASHGYYHRVVWKQSIEEFTEDVKKSRLVVEEITGGQVLGYRAPTYSIRRDTLWALGVLREMGFKYDSSIYPVRHDLYGMPDASRFPVKLLPHRPDLLDQVQGKRWSVDGNTGEDEWLWEFPISTYRVCGFNLPIGGGGYFRLIPLEVTIRLLRRLNAIGKPFIFYIHPWEMDPCVPRIKRAPWKSRFRTYLNVSRNRERFRTLLSSFQFGTVRSVLGI